MITILKYGRTVSRGKGTFEFERVDAESTPDTGQSPDEAFAVLRAFVDAQVNDLLGVPTEKEIKKGADPTSTASTGKASTTPPAKKPSTAPPLAGKKGAKPGSSDPSNRSAPSTTTAPSSTTRDASQSTTTEPPFEEGSKIAAEPAPKKATKKGKKQQAEVPGVAELLCQLPATTRVADVLDLLNEMRSVADRTKGEAVDDWENCLKLVAAHLRSIPGHTEDPSYEDICAAFDAEKEAIATARG